MKKFIKRENEIFNTIQELIDKNHRFVIVGGYAVSAYQHRFSIDADLIIPKQELSKSKKILEDRGFERVEDVDLDVYSGRYLAYEKNKELPVTIDLLVNYLKCRQTDAKWSYEYFKEHSITKIIEGSEKSVEAKVPEKELLIAVKLHSGRLTDARDVIPLSNNIEPDKLEKHLGKGDSKKLNKALKEVNNKINREGFEDSFKGVFQQEELPQKKIQRIRNFIQKYRKKHLQTQS